MNVKIKQAENPLYWYSSNIGEEFSVLSEFHPIEGENRYRLTQDETDRVNSARGEDSEYHLILVDDCEII